MTEATRTDLPPDRAGARPADHTERLVFLAGADQPRGASSSHALDALDDVRFRRGPRAAERTGRALTIAIPDPWMSGTHGGLHRRGERWIFEDPASKNGSMIDGALTRSAALADGALLELGHSYFLFRRTRAAAPPLAPDMDARQLPPGELATFSPTLAAVYRDLVRLAATGVSILLRGETGTGKEVVARAIHERSQRGGALVAVNCGALAPTLVESELFGHRRGAFTGAATDRRGLVRSADNGTLFLDEVAELSAAAQATLLRVLQEREVLPVGEDRPVAVDLRIIAATLRDLDHAVAAGAFRADLFARLAGHVVALPPLRERREDLGLLFAALLPAPDTRFTLAALRELVRYDWPRNIRELEQCCAAASALAPDGAIDRAHLPAAIREHRTAPPPLPPTELAAADRALREQLVALFAAHAGNVVAVAAALGKRRQQIYKWVHRFAIDLAVFRR